MGEKIEFPLNNQMYFDQAIKFIENMQFEKAIECFEKIYKTDQSAKVNQMYTLVLYTLDRNQEALEIANDQKEFYMEDERDAVFYTMLLIKNHLFLEAEVLVQNHLSNPHSLYLTDWQNANRELVLERENSHFQMELKKKETLKELQDIDTFSPAKQIETIHNAHLLDLGELQTVANKLLISPHLGPVSQKAFLELLIEKKDTNSYLFQWVNGPRQVIPNQLKTFDQSDVLNQLSEKLEAKLEKNPSFIEIVQTEIINDLLILFPFVEEIVTDVDFWIDSYLDIFEIPLKNSIEARTLSKEDRRMQKWLNFLNQMAERNTEKS